MEDSEEILIKAVLEITPVDLEEIMKQNGKQLLHHQEKIMVDSEETAVVSDNKNLKILHQVVVTVEALEEAW